MRLSFYLLSFCLWLLAGSATVVVITFILVYHCELQPYTGGCVKVNWPRRTMLSKTVWLMCVAAGEQFHRSCWNWNWHSSSPSWAPSLTDSRAAGLWRQTLSWSATSPVRELHSGGSGAPGSTVNEWSLWSSEPTLDTPRYLRTFSVGRPFHALVWTILVRSLLLTFAVENLEKGQWRLLCCLFFYK